MVSVLAEEKRGGLGSIFLIYCSPASPASPKTRFYRLGIQWAAVGTGTKIIGGGMTLGPEWR